jgi:hypothetical protein
LTDFRVNQVFWFGTSRIQAVAHAVDPLLSDREE